MNKKTITMMRAAVFYGAMITAGYTAAEAQDAMQSSTTTTSTTTSAGTVSEFSPSVITVRSTTAATPVSYSYTKTTTYVDENGNPVASETVKSGAPVTVYYTQEGDKMVASKVVVRRVTPGDGATIVKKSSTTTTTTTAPNP